MIGEGASIIRVALFNGDEFEAELVGSDNRFDIAVLKIEAKGLPAVSVADSDTLKVGEEVVAIGNPLGELTFTMTNGILSALAAFGNHGLAVICSAHALA